MLVVEVDYRSNPGEQAPLMPPGLFKRNLPFEQLGLLLLDIWSISIEVLELRLEGTASCGRGALTFVE